MNYPKITTISLVVGSLLLPTTLVEAKPKEDKGKPAHAEKGKKGKPTHAGKGKKSTVDKGNKNKRADVEKARNKAIAKDHKNWRFVETDRNTIVGYFQPYKDNKHGLPPGLAKNLRRGKPLPPGWQKKVEPGFILEEPWLERFTPVSYEYFPNLAQQKDTRLYLYDDRLFRVYEPERRILDVVILKTVSALLSP